MAVIYIKDDETLPGRSPHDLYRTPQNVLDSICSRFGDEKAVSILDVGAGDGRWGVAFAQYAACPLCLVGVDINPEEGPARPDYYTFWQTLDYSLPIETGVMPVKNYDLIVGNPPFNRAERIIWNAWQQLNPNGQIIFLLPIEFWGSQGRYRGLWRDLPPKEICTIVNRISFKGDSNPNNHAVYIWEKDKNGNPVGTPNESKTTQMIG